MSQMRYATGRVGTEAGPYGMADHRCFTSGPPHGAAPTG